MQIIPKKTHLVKAFDRKHYFLYHRCMAKIKKKRNKKYAGADAAQQKPTITRVQAVNRNPISQWLYERQRLLKTIGIGVIIVLALILIISGIVSLF